MNLLFIKKSLITALTVSLCLSVVGCTRSNPNIALNVGEIPPAISASTLAGESFSLEKYRGSVVLLNFWASWCGPCVSELPALERLYQKLKSRGLVVVAVGVDDSADNLAQTVRTLNLTFPVAVDRGDAKSDYRLTGVPETLFIDRDGKLMLVLDSDSGQASSRILGPRNWDSPENVSRIASLLAY